MNKVFAVFCCLIFLSAACSARYPVKNGGGDPLYNQALEVGSQKIFVQVVQTPAEMGQGLSGREKLKDNRGMLFDFGSAAVKPAFWMKRMKFNLDLIWIRDGKILAITKNVPAPKNLDEPETNLPTYAPPSLVNEVLEVEAGWSDKHNIKVGDEAKLVNDSN